MARYIAQRDNFSCGVLAVLNAAKWQGQSLTLEQDYWLIRRALHCNPKWGSSRQMFNKLALLAGWTRLRSPSLAAFDEVLDEGDALLISSVDRATRIGHLHFTPERTQTHYFCVNVGRRHGWLARSVFRHEFLWRLPGSKHHSWALQHPAAWRVSRVSGAGALRLRSAA